MPGILPDIIGCYNFQDAQEYFIHYKNAGMDLQINLICLLKELQVLCEIRLRSMDHVSLLACNFCS